MIRPSIFLACVALVACSSPRTEAPDCKGETVGANAAGLAPVVWDDRTDTWLRFPGQQRIPAITVLHEDKTEAAVNTSPSPDTGVVRVHGIHPGLVLRDGSRVACVLNRAYDRVGIRPGGGA